MARNRKPKERREARTRAALVRAMNRPAKIHVKPGSRGTGLSRAMLYNGDKERENAIRFYRFIGVVNGGGLNISDGLPGHPKFADLDELYAATGRPQKSKFVAGKLKMLRKRLITQSATI